MGKSGCGVSYRGTGRGRAALILLPQIKIAEPVAQERGLGRRKRDRNEMKEGGCTTPMGIQSFVRVCSLTHPRSVNPCGRQHDGMARALRASRLHSLNSASCSYGAPSALVSTSVKRAWHKAKKECCGRKCLAPS